VGDIPTIPKKASFCGVSMGFYGFLNAEKDAKVGQFGIFLVF
jgi:hypothetical protein